MNEEDQYYNVKEIERLVIPDTVTSIQTNKFKNWHSLKEVIIPSSVTSIGSSAFYNCSGLTSIEFPSSVTSIGVYAFYDCSSLTSITLPFVGGALNGTNNTHFGYIFGASSYSYHYDYIPTSLKEVIITGGTSIRSYAFRGCSNLTNIEIPSSETSIGSGAYYY